MLEKQTQKEKMVGVAIFEIERKSHRYPIQEKHSTFTRQKVKQKAIYNEKDAKKKWKKEDQIDSSS